MWNGDAVQVAFAIDTYDGEILASTARPPRRDRRARRHVAGSRAPLRRLRAVQAVEYLADHGSCFTAHETVAFTFTTGFTLVRSSELNGIAEPSERDYVRLNARPR